MFICLGGEQSVLFSQILADVALPEGDDGGGIQLPGLGGRSRGDAKPQRRVVHGQDHNPRMLGTVLAPPPDVGLDDVAAVQERHLAVGFDPQLVARVGRDHVERRDVQAELARLGELAHAGAE